MNEKINRLRNFLEKLDVIRKKYEDIEAHRIELNNMVEEAFLTGNFDTIKQKLAEYGFNSAEIEN